MSVSNRSSVINQKVDLGIAVADSANLSAIFMMFLQDTWQRFLEDIGHTFMFPLAAAGAVIRAALAWRQAKLDNGKNGTVARAVVETVSAAAITTAVVGGFVAAATFATVAPIIFTAVLAAKTLFHAGSALYYMGKAAVANKSQDPAVREKANGYRSAARAHGVGAVAGIFATAAVALVMLAGFKIFAVLGIVAGVIGIGYSIYKAVTTPTPAAAPIRKEYKPLDEQTPKSENSHTPKLAASNSAKLHQTLVTAPAVTRSAVVAHTESTTASVQTVRLPNDGRGNVVTRGTLHHHEPVAIPTNAQVALNNEHRYSRSL